jgi:type VI secretion system protein ImpJ
MSQTPRRPARIVWEEGMHLAPQHFQGQRRHFEDSLAQTVNAVFPFGYGVTRVRMDADALAGGMLAVEVAVGIFPDGTAVSIPDVDAAPAPSELATRFSPTRDSHIVSLVIPAWQTDAPNVTEETSRSNAARYVEVPSDLRDETTGHDVTQVMLALKNTRLLLDDEITPADVALPIARIRRDGAGRFVLDGSYIPPCLQIAGSERLLTMLASTVGMLEAKGASLAGSLASDDGGSAAPAAYVGNEIATRWLLHAVRSAEAPLRHLLTTRRCHPERLWTELSRLAGALCTFSLTTQSRDLPLYQHDDLEGCFSALDRHLRAHLDLVVAARAMVVPFVRTSEVLYTATIADARGFQAGARWFLGVRSSLSTPETIVRAPQLLKVCAAKFVLELVRRAFPGLTIEHVPAPPAGLAPRQGLAYFEIIMGGPCAQGLNETHELGVYVPDALSGVALELAILIPE